MIHTFKPNLTGKAAKYVNVPPRNFYCDSNCFGARKTRSITHKRRLEREIGIFSDAAQYTMYYVNDTFP